MGVCVVGGDMEMLWMVCVLVTDTDIFRKFWLFLFLFFATIQFRSDVRAVFLVASLLFC